MDDFANILQRDYGLKPQGKMAPMSNAKTVSAATSRTPPAQNPRNVMNRTSSGPVLAGDDPFSGLGGSSSSGRHNTFSGCDPLYDDLFGAPPPAASSANDVLEDMFRSKMQKPVSVSPSSFPAFDKPVYDDDIFGGMPGVRSADSAFEDIFNGSSSVASAAPSKAPETYDDLLGGFNTSDACKVSSIKPQPAYGAGTSTLGEAVLDELLPGFGATEHDKPKSPEDGQPSQYNNSKPVNGFSANIVEDPFAVSDADTLPDAHFPTVPLSPGFPEGTTEHPYVSDLKKDSSETETCMPKKRSPNLGQRSTDTSVPIDNRDVPNPMGVNDDDVISKEYQRKMSDSAAADSSRIATSVHATIPGSSVHRDNAMQSGEADDFSKRRQSFRVSAVSRSKGREEEASQIPNPSRSRRVDEYWISVENVKLVTRPSTAPPPARSPPLPDSRHSYSQRKPSQNGRATENGGHSPTGSHVNGGLDSADSILEDLEAFASGRPLCADADEKDYGASSQGGSDLGSATATASGAAMRDAIEKAEAKLQRAKEAKDKKMEEVRGTTNKEGGTRQRRETDSTEKWLKEREKEKQRERERDREKDGANEIACQRAAADARERLERAAAEKAKVQQAAAAEQKDADKGRMAASKDQDQKNEDDLDSFFRASSRPTSEPKQRTHPSDGFRTAQQSDEGFRRNISTAGNVKKVSSMPSMADDLTSLFGGPSSGNGTFQEVEGETEERRKARWDRHQRMLERTAKALEEKRQRDLQSVKEQEERHRAAELVDAEIKRWAAGKEGNLRALLSSLHYVLWPECGWQPVSLTDLITSSAVKKVYKKATLHVHPDKVQQKGATSRQKYIAEKVFDLLKEAWNKFNAEELF